jgi:hypothetical protein
VFAGPQAGGTGRSGFSLYSSRITAGVDTAIVTEEGRVEDGVFVFVPTAVAFQKPSPRSNLQFIYEPEIEIYQTRSDLNAINHAAAIAYSREPARRSGLRAGGSFLRTHDRSRQTSGLAVSPRGLYVEGRGYASLDHRLGPRTSIRLGAQSWLTRSQAPTFTDFSGELDEWRNSFTVGLGRALNEAHELSVAYTRFESSFLNAEELTGEDLDDRGGQDSLSGAYTATLVASGVRFGGSAGLIRLPRESGDEYTYSLATHFDKAWSSFNFGVSYQRSLSGQLRFESDTPADVIRDPLLDDGVAQSANVTLGGEIGRRLTLSGQVSLSRTDVAGFETPLETFVVTTDVGLVLTDRLIPMINLMYWDQQAPQEVLTYSRTRITAGLRFFWDAPPSGRRMNYENVRGILPIRPVGQ